MKKKLSIVALCLLGAVSMASAYPAAQDNSIKQDTKDAGKATGDAAKKAGKDVTKGTKKAAKATANGTKKGVHKAAGATEKGADKVKDKTSQ
jgi:hypothetical protein